jgi:hypothetical protein
MSWKKSFKSSNQGVRTFFKLQEAMGSKQVGTPRSIAYGAPPPPTSLPSHGDAATQGQSNPGNQGNKGYI